MSAKPGPSGLVYLKRMKWFLVNPIKALLKAFLDEMCTGKNVKYLLTSRHLPVIFEDVVKVFSDFGLLMPVTKYMLQTMPKVSNLMRYNTYSETHLPLFLSKFQSELLIAHQYNKECLFFQNHTEDPQFSNVPMAISIVIFLLQTDVVSADFEGVQHIVRCNHTQYDVRFSQGNCYGVDKNFKLDEHDPNAMDEYSQLLHMQFRHPLVDSNPYFRYSLSDVIHGLFYGSERPDDFQLPEAPSFWTKMETPVEYRLSRKERVQMNTYLHTKFFVFNHFYETIGISMKDEDSSEPAPVTDQRSKKRRRSTVPTPTTGNQESHLADEATAPTEKDVAVPTIFSPTNRVTWSAQQQSQESPYIETRDLNMEDGGDEISLFSTFLPNSPERGETMVPSPQLDTEPRRSSIADKSPETEEENGGSDQHDASSSGSSCTIKEDSPFSELAKHGPPLPTSPQEDDGSKIGERYEAPPGDNNAVFSIVEIPVGNDPVSPLAEPLTTTTHLPDNILDDPHSEDLVDNEALLQSDLTEQIRTTFIELQELALLRASYNRATKDFKLKHSPKNQVPVPSTSFLGKKEDGQEQDNSTEHDLSETPLLEMLKRMSIKHVSGLPTDVTCCFAGGQLGYLKQKGLFDV